MGIQHNVNAERLYLTTVIVIIREFEESGKLLLLDIYAGLTSLLEKKKQ
jgi:hypothetical protein